MQSVGVRELRQNASVLLEQVASSGLSLTITNHGRPVARLVPIHQAAVSTRAALIEDGVLHPGRGDILDIQPIPAPWGTPKSSELLSASRDDR